MRQAQLVWKRGAVELARSQAWMAETYWTRARGLLGRPPLLPGEALKIVPCNSIHCFFMTSMIDVVFLDVKGCVLRTCPQVRPWRGRVCRKAKVVIELAAGEIHRLGIKEGDRCC